MNKFWTTVAILATCTLTTPLVAWAEEPQVGLEQSVGEPEKDTVPETGSGEQTDGDGSTGVDETPVDEGPVADPEDPNTVYSEWQHGGLMPH